MKKSGILFSEPAVRSCRASRVLFIVLCALLLLPSCEQNPESAVPGDPKVSVAAPVLATNVFNLIGTVVSSDDPTSNPAYPAGLSVS